MRGLIIRNLLLQQKFQVGFAKFLPLKTLPEGFGSIGIQGHHLLLVPQCQSSTVQYLRSCQFQDVGKISVANNIQCRHPNRNYSKEGEKNSTVSINITDPIDNKNSSNSTNPQKSSKFKKYAIITICIVYGGMFLSILYNLGLPSIDEEGRELRDEFSHMPPLEQFFRRMFDRLYVFKEFLRRPSREHLLPPPHPQRQPKYTLVLEVTHVLLYPDWTYQTGWRFKKRPNVDHFLEQLASPLYEIVVFTSQAGMNMSAIIDSLDKGAGGNRINYSLYRDATEFINGEHVKNLSHLNRDLSKVIVIDWNPAAVQFHRENALILPKWSGNDDDRTLAELVSFLKSLAERSPDDVREVLRHYGEDPMEEYREARRRLPELSS